MQHVRRDYYIKAAVGVWQVENILHGEIQLRGLSETFRFLYHFVGAVGRLNHLCVADNVPRYHSRTGSKLEDYLSANYGTDEGVHFLVCTLVLFHEALVYAGVF